MFLSKLLSATTLTALIAVLIAFGGASSTTAQDKKDEPKKDEKKDEPKKDATELKTRLKKFEDEIARIRESMLKEVEAEEKRLEDVLKKAQKDHADAMKNKDFDAMAKALQAQNAVRVELIK